jgi:hypothetical protein
MGKERNCQSEVPASIGEIYSMEFSLRMENEVGKKDRRYFAKTLRCC